MPRPRVLVLRAAGVNCENETAYAWEIAGALPDVVHVNALATNPRHIDDYQILTIPGGFSYGDDISAGRILAQQLGVVLGDVLTGFAASDRLILGICNGFQVLCKVGLLPGRQGAVVLPAVTIDANDSRKYEDRWVRLQRATDVCPFLTGRSDYELPIAHGEGRVVTRCDEDMRQLQECGCLALQYGAADGGAVGYPDNPNGSMMDTAGLCDPSGRIFGLMPHPERFIHRTHHPEWTSRPELVPHGKAIFEAAVAYFA